MTWRATCSSPLLSRAGRPGLTCVRLGGHVCREAARGHRRLAALLRRERALRAGFAPPLCCRCPIASGAIRLSATCGFSRPPAPKRIGADIDSHSSPPRGFRMLQVPVPLLRRVQTVHPRACRRARRTSDSDGTLITTKIHGSYVVQVRRPQMAARGRGRCRLAHMLFDDDWSEWLPNAWAMSTREGVIIVDNGGKVACTSAAITRAGIRSTDARRDSRSIPTRSTQLRHLGIDAPNIRDVVLTHLHTIYGGGRTSPPTGAAVGRARRVERARECSGAVALPPPLAEAAAAEAHSLRTTAVRSV